VLDRAKSFLAEAFLNSAEMDEEFGCEKLELSFLDLKPLPA
jgi:hypothetical protein